MEQHLHLNLNTIKKVHSFFSAELISNSAHVYQNNFYISFI